MKLVIGTLNIVSLNGKVEEIIDMMQERKLNILGLSETKWKESGSKDLREGYKLWWSGGNKGFNGVGLIVSASTKEAVLSVEFCSDRIIKMCIMIEGKPTEIIQCYAPQVGRPMMEKVEFIEEIEATITSDRVVIMGDLNAKVGTDRCGFEEVLGEHGHGRRDREGILLLEMCARNALIIGNSLFKKRVSHKVTRYGWDGMSESVIDYIITSRELVPTNVGVMPNIAMDGDHRLLVATIKCEKSGISGKKKVGNNRIKAWKLQEEKGRDTFQARIRKKLPVGCLLTVEEEWQAFKMEIVSSAEDICGRAKGRKKKKETPWWNERVREAVCRKREAWQRNEKQRSNDNYREYKKCKYAVRQVVGEEKTKSMEKFADRLEKDFDGNKKMLYGLIQGKRRSSEDPSVMYTNEGVLVTRPEEIKDLWHHYFENLLNVNEQSDLMEEPGGVEVKEDEEYGVPSQEDGDEELCKEEVRRLLNKMKNGRAPGVDELTVDMLKAAGDVGLEWLLRIMRAAWNQKRIPGDWEKGVIVPIFKKGDRKKCGNYRGVTIMCHCAKLYEKVLESRLKADVEQDLREEQYGFRRGRSTIDLIFAVRQIMESRWEAGEAMHMAFLDLEKAYDRLPRERVWKALEDKQVSKGLVDRIKSTYRQSLGCVQTRGGRTNWFEMKNGLRQGSVLSPLLFIIVMDELIKVVEPIGQRADTRTFVYADDVMVWGENEREVQEKIDKWSQITEEFGLRISKEKSESLIMERKPIPSHQRIKIMLRGEDLEVKEQFKYLGSLLSSDAKIDDEIRKRVNSAMSFYQLVRKLLWDEGFPKRCKVLMYKSYFVPILTYGAVTWTLGGLQEQRIEAAEMKFLRSIAGVTKMDKIRSKEIRKRLGVEQLSYKIGKERLRWFGHMKRMDEGRIPRREYEKSSQAGVKRRVGRPRDRWARQIQCDVEDRNEVWECVREEQWWKNREVWKALVQKEEAESVEEDG